MTTGPESGVETEFGLIGLTPDGIIESWNGGAERLTGYAGGEAIGQHFSLFYTAEDRSNGLPETYLREARTEKAAFHSGWRIRKDGSRFWSEVQITAMFGIFGNLMGYAKVIRDLTETVRLDAADSTFYNSFIHDFRVPVAAIKGFTELVPEADADERQHFLDRVDSNADRMMDMTEDLVEHARDHSGHPVPKLEAVDLTTLARQVAEDLLGDTSRITVAQGSVVVLADSAILHRVIANVLTNALKYSEPGSLISFTTAESESEGVLRVTDHGRGIDPGDLETVFLEFQRGRLAGCDGGTGLGLASARQLVEQLGGTMRVESQVDAGTTVAINLPKQREPA